MKQHPRRYVYVCQLFSTYPSFHLSLCYVSHTERIQSSRAAIGSQQIVSYSIVMASTSIYTVAFAIFQLISCHNNKVHSQGRQREEEEEEASFFFALAVVAVSRITAQAQSLSVNDF